MKEILCFGDSNTHGYMPGIGTRYPADTRWSGRLGTLLGDGYHVVEEGMDGRTTAFEDEIQPYRSALGYIVSKAMRRWILSSSCLAQMTPRPATM